MKQLLRFFQVFIVVAIPLLLLMGAIRLMLTPAFINFEYRQPNFPEDVYGFSTADRLKWADLSIQYLLNSEPPSYLADLRLDPATPLFNERELSHMLDVKVLVQRMLTALWVLGGILALLGFFFHWRKQTAAYWHALASGGYAALGLLGFVLVMIFTAFDWLFTKFHNIFFVGDTWLFLYTDSLIRLFPMKFWQDAFIGVGILTGLGALFLILFGNRLARKQPSVD